jgi:hypothetical protein
VGVGGQRHAPATLPPPPRGRPGINFIEGWVDPRAGLEGAENHAPTGIRSPDRQARSESLYRLSYPGQHGEEISITYSECVFVALGIQHEIRMRYIILASVASPALLYFPTLSHERQDFVKNKGIEYYMCVLIFSANFV